jgi:transposase-like protein
VITISQIKSLKKLDISYNKVQALKEQQFKDYLKDCEVININLVEKKTTPLSGDPR